MRRTGLVLGTVGLLLALGLAAVRLLDDGESRELDPQTPDAEKRQSGAQEAEAELRADGETRSQTLAIRRRGGIPRAWVRRISEAPGVTAVARTGRTQLLLRRTRGRGGATVETSPRGYAFPLDALVVRARSYAEVLPPSARASVRRLRPGTTLLSRSSARLRRVGNGGRLGFADGRTLRVVGVLDDRLARGAELVVGPRDSGAGGARSTQLVVTTTQPRRIAGALPTARAVRIAPFEGSARRARGGIARPLELKARFGEFAVGLPYGADWIRLEPRWLRRNIVSRRVPVLGEVTCNRRFFAPLRRALGELARHGLSRLVDRGDYAGCYAPRRIPGSGSPSLHAWGLAIDLNASQNPQYGESRHDPRLVRVMERAGFTWGGRWPTAPDPMHFELQEPASG